MEGITWQSLTVYVLLGLLAYGFILSRLSRRLPLHKKKALKPEQK